MRDIMHEIAERNPRKSVSELVKGDMFRYQFEADGRREAVEVLQDVHVDDPALPAIVWAEVIRTGNHARIRMVPGAGVDLS